MITLKCGFMPGSNQTYKCDKGIQKLIFVTAEYRGKMYFAAD